MARNKTFRDALAKILEDAAVTINAEGKPEIKFHITPQHSRLEVVAMRLVETAILKSDMTAIKEIIERVDGKAIQVTKELNPVQIINISPALRDMLMKNVTPVEQKRIGRLLEMQKVEPI